MKEPRYWHEIKRIKLDPIRVTPNQAAQITDEWVNKGAAVVMIKGKPYATNVFTEIEETTSPITEDNIYLLTSGEEMGKAEALLNMEGHVVCNWYKKPVSRKEYERKYAGISSYRVLEVSGDGMWVAMRLPEMVNDLSTNRTHLTQCNADEVRSLDGRTNV